MRPLHLLHRMTQTLGVTRRARRVDVGHQNRELLAIDACHRFDLPALHLQQVRESEISN